MSIRRLLTASAALLLLALALAARGEAPATPPAPAAPAAAPAMPDTPPGLPGVLPGRVSQWRGFERHDFVFEGCSTIIVVPPIAAPGKPWLWRAKFFNHRPEVDAALVGKGFHLVYIEIGNTFGCPDALKHWDALYKELTERYGFSRKVALEGLSRGGLDCFNWAAANPDKVACIYADAPVCDFKSWPGGKGKGKGSPLEWKKLLADYGFKSEAEALAYAKNPIDNLAPLARAGIPLLHVCGDADDIVPYAENTALVKERYEKLGGRIQVILKPGVGHVHGLEDPTAIVEFVWTNAGGGVPRVVPAAKAST